MIEEYNNDQNICMKSSLCQKKNSEIKTKCKKEDILTVSQLTKENLNNKNNVDELIVNTIQTHNEKNNQKFEEEDSSFHERKHSNKLIGKMSFKPIRYFFKNLIKKTKRIKTKRSTSIEEKTQNNLAIALRLPPGLNISKNSHLKIELEVERQKTFPTTTILSENDEGKGGEVCLNCVKISDSTSIFEGNLKVPSNTQFQDVIEMPLYLLEYKEKLRSNSEIDLKHYPIIIKPAVISEIQKQDERIEVNGIKLKIKLSRNNDLVSQSKSLTTTRRNDYNFLKCSIIKTLLPETLSNCIKQNRNNNITALFHVRDISDIEKEYDQQTNNWSNKQLSVQMFPSGEDNDSVCSACKNKNTCLSEISGEFSPRTSNPFLLNENNKESLLRNKSLNSVESVWPQSTSSNDSAATVYSISSVEKVPANTPVLNTISKSESRANITISESNHSSRNIDSETFTRSSRSNESTESYEGMKAETLPCNFLAERTTRQLERDKNYAARCFSTANKRNKSKPKTLTLLEKARFKLMRYLEDTAAGLIREEPNTFSCARNFNNTVECYFATSISNHAHNQSNPNGKTSRLSEINSIKSNEFDSDKQNSSEKRIASNNPFDDEYDRTDIFPSIVSNKEIFKNDFLKENVKEESIVVTNWFEKIYQMAEVIKKDKEHAENYQNTQDQLLTQFVDGSHQFLKSTDQLLHEIVLKREKDAAGIIKRKIEEEMRSKDMLQIPSVSINEKVECSKILEDEIDSKMSKYLNEDYPKNLEFQSSTTIRRSSETRLSKECIDVVDDPYMNENELFSDADVEKVEKTLSIAQDNDTIDSNKVTEQMMKRTSKISIQSDIKSNFLDLEDKNLSQSIETMNETFNEELKEKLRVDSTLTFAELLNSGNDVEIINIHSSDTIIDREEGFCENNENLNFKLEQNENIYECKYKDKYKEVSNEESNKSDEIKKTFDVVQKDIKKIIKELLKSSQEIKNLTIYNGAKEDEPLFTYDYVGKKQNKENFLKKSSAEKERIENEMRTIANLIVDIALDKIFAKSNEQEISSDSLQNSSVVTNFSCEEEKIGDQHKEDFDSMFKICLEELIRQSVPRNSLNASNDILHSNNKIVSSQKNTTFFNCPKSIQSKIPKTSYIFGKKEPFEKIACTSCCAINKNNKTNNQIFSVEKSKSMNVQPCSQSHDVILFKETKDDEDYKNYDCCNESNSNLQNEHQRKTATVSRASEELLDQTCVDNSNNLENSSWRNLIHECSDNIKNDNSKENNPESEKDEMETSHESDHETKNPPAVKESPKFQIINAITVTAPKNLDQQNIKSSKEEEEHVAAIEAESFSRDGISEDYRLCSSVDNLSNAVTESVVSVEPSSDKILNKLKKGKQIIPPSSATKLGQIIVSKMTPNETHNEILDLNSKNSIDKVYHLLGKEKITSSNLKKSGAVTKIITVNENKNLDKTNKFIQNSYESKYFSAVDYSTVTDEALSLPNDMDNIITDFNNTDYHTENSKLEDYSAAANDEDCDYLIVLKSSEIYNNVNSTSNIPEVLGYKEEQNILLNNTNEISVKKSKENCAEKNFIEVDESASNPFEVESSTPTVAENKQCTVRFEQNCLKSMFGVPFNEASSSFEETQSENNYKEDYSKVEGSNSFSKRTHSKVVFSSKTELRNRDSISTYSSINEPENQTDENERRESTDEREKINTENNELVDVKWKNNNEFGCNDYSTESDEVESNSENLTSNKDTQESLSEDMIPQKNKKLSKKSEKNLTFIPKQQTGIPINDADSLSKSSDGESAINSKSELKSVLKNSKIVMQNKNFKENDLQINPGKIESKEIGYDGDVDDTSSSNLCE